MLAACESDIKTIETRIAEMNDIVISEKNGKLDIQITLNGEFRMHIDYYDESGDITGRDAEVWYFPNWENMTEM